MLPGFDNHTVSTVFDRWHPAVPLLLFVALIGISMGAFQPVFLAISLGGALSYSIYLRGPRAVLKSLVWQLPLMILIALINPLFSARGSSELFRLGTQAIYLESLVYGLCMACSLLAMLLWFSNAARVLSTDKVMGLLGGVLPTLSLMISMCLRLVPQLIRRGREISAVQECCGIACPSGFRGRMAWSGRMISVLMGWAMEDSLERADAMRARAWGRSRTRSRYRTRYFRLRDALVCVVVGALAVCAALLAVLATGEYQFYPSLSILRLWWGYLPWLVLVLLPLLLELFDRASWIGVGRGAV